LQGLKSKFFLTGVLFQNERQLQGIKYYLSLIKSKRRANIFCRENWGKAKQNQNPSLSKEPERERK
jgi:hypothetical protein